MSYMTKSKLYHAQDQVMQFVFGELDHLVPDTQVILGGGTALARCYLNHRISYDLDFFIGSKFDPAFIEHMLNRGGFQLQITGLESGGMYAAQLHGTITEPRTREEIKVSFVQDFFTGIFSSATVNGIRTEIVDGLYHRKLRTVSGTGEVTSSSGRTLGVGNRQTARDLFDLYILDQKIEPIDRFIKQINTNGAGFPQDLFLQGLAGVPWMDLMDEFEALEVIPPHSQPAAMDLKRAFDQVLRRILECDVNMQHQRRSSIKKNAPGM